MLSQNKKKRDRRTPSIQHWWQTQGTNAIKISLLILTAGLITALFPSNQFHEYSNFRESAIAPEEIIAPQTFSVIKRTQEYEQAKQAARDAIAPIVILNQEIQNTQLTDFERFISQLQELQPQTRPDSLIYNVKQNYPALGPLSESTFHELLNASNRSPKTLQKIITISRDILVSAYQGGILQQKKSTLNHREVTLITASISKRYFLEKFIDHATFIQDLQGVIKRRWPLAAAEQVKTIYELVLAFSTPNLSYDQTETEKQRQEAADNISRIKGTVLKGERIVDEHDRITADHIDKLNSLAQYINTQHQEDPLIYAIQKGGQAVISALLLAILFGFLSIVKPTIYRRVSNIILFDIIILTPCLVAYYAADTQSISPFLVPVALSAMLATVLFDAEIGLVISLVCSILCASILGGLQYGLVFLITGVIGAYSVRQVRHRSDFYRSIVFLTITYILTIASSSSLSFTYIDPTEFFTKIRQDLLIGIFIACASSILTIGLLPIFESIFSVVTPITLLELSDLNRTLLRNLAIRAPGTYSHSMNMANISESAADAIGADRLLARVGCYYHDIGKMIRPHYFIENQKGINPHDELQPKMSALILISHVKEGMELAEEEGLPRAIIDLIPQHHGTSEIASFKHRALEQGDKQSVRDEDFRYPGPKPQTKEAGIINLADAVESATRTLSTNDPDQIKSMVQTIIKGRFTAGELDECDLTLRDLHKIQEAFLPVLQASRHKRVPYPWQVRNPDRSKKEQREKA
ncbi:MAG: putative nucleotidyltransferase with HDIG domain [Candidatus Latescibacterota bacterium]|jgi:putative nucleotidyltransferase with HDIG domain